jgi:YidC/Oxa1 family membrane protein insertase
MGNLFNLYLIKPFFNALILIYNFFPIHDIGVATIILTFIIRLILYPLFHKSTKQQILMNRLQPELQKIQKEFKDDKEKQVKAQMELYKKYKVNPLGGCLLTLIQLPIILAVYKVFLNGFAADQLNNLYNFVTRPEIINANFLGIVDLSKTNVILVIISAALQFIASKMIMPKKSETNLPSTNETPAPAQKMTNMMQKQMLFIGPVMTLIILFPLPSIIALYWSATTIFSIFQQWFVQKTLNKVESEQKIITQ